MTHYAELTATPSTNAPAALSAAAQRMRLHRERRRLGLRCLSIQLRETEVEALVHKGLLNAEMRNDPIAVSKALYTFLEHTLG